MRNRILNRLGTGCCITGMAFIYFALGGVPHSLWNDPVLLAGNAAQLAAGFMLGILGNDLRRFKP